MEPVELFVVNSSEPQVEARATWQEIPLRHPRVQATPTRVQLKETTQDSAWVSLAAALVVLVRVQL